MLIRNFLLNFCSLDIFWKVLFISSVKKQQLVRAIFYSPYLFLRLIDLKSTKVYSIYFFKVVCSEKVLHVPCLK